MSNGIIVQVIGAVVDVQFPQDSVPQVYDALKIVSEGQTKGLVLEVQQQTGGGVVRCIAMGTSDGLRRGAEVVNTGEAIKVPVGKAVSIGMRKLSESDFVERALKVVQGKARVKRTMWSRRAQEYEAKINSGDLVSIAEVTRDLFRADDQPEQSYSERQIFEAASSRLARELGAMEESDEKTAQAKILQILNEHAPLYYAEKAL